MFVLFEVALIAGIVDAPVRFCSNVIFNLGIGPVLLKDVYIMGVQRTWALPPALYHLIIYWAAISVAAFLGLASRSLHIC